MVMRQIKNLYFANTFKDDTIAIHGKRFARYTDILPKPYEH